MVVGEVDKNDKLEGKVTPPKRRKEYEKVHSRSVYLDAVAPLESRARPRHWEEMTVQADFHFEALPKPKRGGGEMVNGVHSNLFSCMSSRFQGGWAGHRDYWWFK